MKRETYFSTEEFLRKTIKYIFQCLYSELVYIIDQKTASIGIFYPGGYTRFEEIPEDVRVKDLREHDELDFLLHCKEETLASVHSYIKDWITVSCNDPARKTLMELLDTVIEYVKTLRDRNNLSKERKERNQNEHKNVSDSTCPACKCVPG